MCAQTIGQSRQEKVGARQQRGRRDTRGALADEKALRRRGERDLRSDLSAPLAIAACADCARVCARVCALGAWPPALCLRLLLSVATLCMSHISAAALRVTQLCVARYSLPRLQHCASGSRRARALFSGNGSSTILLSKPRFPFPALRQTEPIGYSSAARLLPMPTTACQVRTRVLVPTRPTLDIVCRLRWVRTCSLSCTPWA